MVKFMFSALVALVLTVTTVALGQLFKEHLSSSRQGTLFAGGIGSLIFMFSLTAISNFKMALNSSVNIKSGLFDVILALLIGVFSSAAIHRIAITICLLFSGILLFFLNAISRVRYDNVAHVVSNIDKKRK